MGALEAANQSARVCALAGFLIAGWPGQARPWRNV